MAITSGATFARSHGVASLGNRAVFAWADDRDGNFEIYAKVLGLDLLDVEPRRRLTSDPGDSTNPLLSLSDQGSIGIIFDDTETVRGTLLHEPLVRSRHYRLSKGLHVQQR
jgi:hypothetical protein